MTCDSFIPVYNVLQGGKDSWDPLSLQVIFRKSDLYLVALLWKKICNLTDPMSLRHLVSSFLYITCYILRCNRSYNIEMFTSMHARFLTRIRMTRLQIHELLYIHITILCIHITYTYNNPVYTPLYTYIYVQQSCIYCFIYIYVYTPLYTYNNS